MKRILTLVALLSLVWLPGAMPLHGAVTPVSVTSGKLCPPPRLEAERVVVGPLESVAIPLDGWKVVWPGLEEAKLKEVTSGISCHVTNDIVRGAVLPVLRIELTTGSFQKIQPALELAWPFNAETHNLLTLTARIDAPTNCLPQIGDSSQVMTGWYSFTFNRYFDDFGIAPDDGCAQWVSWGVPTTHFKTHDLPETRGADGYTDFIWDMKYDTHTGNKGFFRDRVRALRFYYDTRKIPKGAKVVISITQPKVTSNTHSSLPDPERWAAWTNFVANYKPDFSDSSKELGPPATGRIARPIRIVDNRKPRAEIVVDLSDAILIDKFFPKQVWTYELEAARGYEGQVARQAAEDLRFWIKKITGADLPVLIAPSAEKNVKIFLGASYARERFPDDIKLLTSGGAHDGFAVRVSDGNLYIFGAAPAGTLFGVHRFVENNTDIIWAYSDDPAGTVYTDRPTLDIVWADTVSKPVFIQRGGGGSAQWKRANGRNFMGGQREHGQFHVNGGHYLCPQYYDWSEGLNQFNPVVDRSKSMERATKWSEYRTLACLAHPEFRRRAMEVVPGVRHLRYRMNFSRQCLMGVDDNYVVCECDLCTAPIKTVDGQLITPDTHYAEYYSAWFYQYLNNLDAEIQKVWPGFITSTFAYFFAAPYPPIEVSRNIAPMICTYVRKSQEEPIFSPANRHWWKIYNDWMAHNPNTMLYDYYALGLSIRGGVAEVVKFDLQAQRDIGFLRNYSEGWAFNEYLGGADEQWCLNRLQWDPDQDVEQLHRRFTRRTYREAAPCIEKFRGRIREACLKHFHASIDFEDLREYNHLIRFCGLEEELRGYLTEAQKAARHPNSKILIDKMIADWDYHLSTESGWLFPSRGMKGPQDPIGKAVHDTWGQNRGVFNDADGRKLLACVISPRRTFDLKCPVPSPAHGHDVTFTFDVPAGFFSLAGYPVVTLADQQRTPCDYGWSHIGDGAWNCHVRVPAAEAGAFRFALDASLPADAFSLPRNNIDTALTLKDISITPAAAAKAKPAPARIAYMTTPAYAALLDDIRTNAIGRLATTATNAAAPALRLLAANACVARSRGDTVALALPLYEANRGKMKELGTVWADQIQPLVRGRLNAGAPDALAWAREQFEAAGLDGNATRESMAFGNLIEATLKAGDAAAARKLVDDHTATMSANAAAAFQVRRTAAPVFAANGFTDEAIAIMREAMADRRIDESVRRPFVEKMLAALVAGARTTFPADRYVALWREFDDDFLARAHGRSIAVANWRWFLERQLGSAYGDRYEFEPMARIYDAWIDWDGDQLPVGFRAERQGIAIGYFRGRLKWLDGRIANCTQRLKQQPDNAQITDELARAEAAAAFLKQELARRVPVWHATLRETEKNGHDEKTRTQAYTTLMNEAWDGMKLQQRVDALARIVDNKFNDHNTRRDAARRMSNLHITSEGTNWNAVAESVVRNIGAGDWSSNERNTYRQKRTTDIRLDYAVEYADKLIAAGQGAIARTMLEKAAPLLGYYADTTAADEPGTSEADMNNRLERLDKIMAKCGASRPPRPAR
ncbi:MAG: DUF4838 domain-containing protein [Lentisphaerae bacterium]|nr:DUF4838 domain-containing protein [Lentisphaerota bacterium]